MTHTPRSKRGHVFFSSRCTRPGSVRTNHIHIHTHTHTHTPINFWHHHNFLVRRLTTLHFLHDFHSNSSAHTHTYSYSLFHLGSLQPPMVHHTPLSLWTKKKNTKQKRHSHACMSKILLYLSFTFYLAWKTKRKEKKKINRKLRLEEISAHVRLIEYLVSNQASKHPKKHE